MTTNEHLDLILAKCQEGLLNQLPPTEYGKRARAGWRSTIAAIEWALKQEKLHGVFAPNIFTGLLESILTAWPLDLLQ